MLFAGWLVANFQLAAISAGFDWTWFGRVVPESLILPMRKAGIAAYCLLTIALVRPAVRRRPQAASRALDARAGPVVGRPADGVRVRGAVRDLPADHVGVGGLRRVGHRLPADPHPAHRAQRGGDVVRRVARADPRFGAVRGARRRVRHQGADRCGQQRHGGARVEPAGGAGHRRAVPRRAGQAGGGGSGVAARVEQARVDVQGDSDRTVHRRRERHAGADESGVSHDRGPRPRGRAARDLVGPVPGARLEDGRRRHHALGAGTRGAPVGADGRGALVRGPRDPIRRRGRGLAAGRDRTQDRERPAAVPRRPRSADRHPEPPRHRDELRAAGATPDPAPGGARLPRPRPLQADQRPVRPSGRRRSPAPAVRAGQVAPGRGRVLRPRRRRRVRHPVPRRAHRAGARHLRGAGPGDRGPAVPDRRQGLPGQGFDRTDRARPRDQLPRRRRHRGPRLPRGQDRPSRATSSRTSRAANCSASGSRSCG